jgi:hypothetical protein
MKSYLSGVYASPRRNVHCVPESIMVCVVWQEHGFGDEEKLASNIDAF